jgi:predicted DNA-binding WGR domain protein
MTALILHRLDPVRNLRRFYRLDVQPDLFGAWGLIREWGRAGQAGQLRVDPLSDRGGSRGTDAAPARGEAGQGLCPPRRLILPDHMPDEFLERQTG